MGSTYRKKINTNRIIKIIREKGPISRIDISAQTKITQSTITRITEELLKAKIIKEIGTVTSARGRRPILLTFNPRCHYSIGVQFSRLKVAVKLTDLDGKVYSSRFLKQPKIESFESVINFIHTSIDEVVEEAGVTKKRLLGIGIGLPGPLNDLSDGTISPPNFYNQKKIPLLTLFEERHKLPVYLDNSSNVAALSEKWFGNGIGHNNMLYIFAEAGIGAGIFIGGELYRGNNGEAGLIGHLTIDYDGNLCTCGNYGCLETFSSISSIEENVKKKLKLSSPVERDLFPGDIDNIEFEDIIHAELKQSKIANEAFQEAGRFLGVGVANLVNLFDPEIIVIGGKLGVSSPRIIQSIKETLNQRTLSLKSNNITVIKSGIEDPVVLGASALVIDDAFSLYSSFSFNN